MKVTECKTVTCSIGSCTAPDVNKNDQTSGDLMLDVQHYFKTNKKKLLRIKFLWKHLFYHSFQRSCKEESTPSGFGPKFVFYITGFISRVSTQPELHYKRWNSKDEAEIQVLNGRRDPTMVSSVPKVILKIKVHSWPRLVNYLVDLLYEQLYVVAL